MKLFKIFVLLIIILALVFFLMQNVDRATVNMIYQQYTDVTVAVIMLVSLGIGLLLGFLTATTSIISAKNSARILRSQNKKLVKELNQLRNVNIPDDDTVPDLLSEK